MDLCSAGVTSLTTLTVFWSCVWMNVCMYVSFLSFFFSPVGGRTDQRSSGSRLKEEEETRRRGRRVVKRVKEQEASEDTRRILSCMIALPFCSLSIYVCCFFSVLLAAGRHSVGVSFLSGRTAQKKAKGKRHDTNQHDTNIHTRARTHTHTHETTQQYTTTNSTARHHSTIGTLDEPIIHPRCHASSISIRLLAAT